MLRWIRLPWSGAIPENLSHTNFIGRKKFTFMSYRDYEDRKHPDLRY